MLCVGLSMSFVIASLPVAPVSAAAAPTPVSNNVNDPAAAAPASLISAVVPFLPMEPGGTAFARIFTLNIGSSPTAESSKTSIDIAGLPAGVTVVGATPTPTETAGGWKCEASRCSWVLASGKGAQIPMGGTVDGLLQLKIAPTAQLPILTDDEVAKMGDLDAKDDAAQKKAMDDIAARLSRVNVSTLVEGDTSATSQQTQAYLAVTDKPGRARAVPIVSGPTSAEPGDPVSFSVSQVNIGGAPIAAGSRVFEVFPADLGLDELTTAGEGWSCQSTGKSLGGCAYADEIAAGAVSSSMQVTGVVTMSAATGENRKWVVSADTAPPAVPTDVTFTVTEPQSPDLGVDLTTSTPVVVAGGTLSLSAQIATYGGKTTSPVTLEITGVPGATVLDAGKSEVPNDKVSLDSEGAPTPVPPQVKDSITAPSGARSTVNGVDASAVEATTAATEPVADLSECKAIEDGVVCQVRPIKKAEVLLVGMQLQLPKEFASANKDAKNQSISLNAEIKVADEDEATLANNTDSTPIVVQPANIPYPTITPVRPTDDGTFEKFSGDAMFVRAGTEDARSFAIVNSGAVEFPAGTVFEVEVATGVGFDVTPTGWNCTAKEVAAPLFTDDRRVQASISASAQGVLFDVDRAASPIEEQLMKQVKAQTEKTPIAQVTGEVPGFSCSLTIDEPLGTDGLSTPLTFATKASIDADTSIQIWKVSLVEPVVDMMSSADFTVMTKARRHVVRPQLVTTPLRAGGSANLAVGVVNKGEDVADHPAVLVAPPSRTVVTAATSTPKGWTCVQIAPGLGAGLVVCSGTSLKPGESSEPATFNLKAFADRDKATSASAVALTNGNKVGLTSATAAEVGVKAPIKIQITGPDTVNDVSIPLDGGNPTNTLIYVSAQSSTEGLRYEWNQLCTKAGEPNCLGVAPAVTFKKRYGPSAEVVMPSVKASTDITLAVTGYDGDAKTTSVKVIKLEPKPVLKAPPAQGANSAGIEGTVPAAPGQSLRLPRSGNRVTASAPVAPVDEGSSVAESGNDNKGGKLEAVPKIEMARLEPADSKGSGSTPGITTSPRALGSVSVRANVLGGNLIAAKAGEEARALAAASIGSEVTWSWRVVGGNSPIASNQTFVDAVAALTSPSFRVTLPENASDEVPATDAPADEAAATDDAVTDTVAPSDTDADIDAPNDPTTTLPPTTIPAAGSNLRDRRAAASAAGTDDLAAGAGGQYIIVAVTVTTKSGERYEDILVISIGDEVSETITKQIALEGVSTNNQLILGVGGAATIGAAVAAGNSIEWVSSSDALTLSDQSSTGITITAGNSPTTGSITALVTDKSGNIVDAIVVRVVATAVPALDDFCEQITTEVKSLADQLPRFDLTDELSQRVPSCSDFSSIEFFDKSLNLEFFSLVNVSGRVTRDGIWLSSGTVSTTLELPIKELKVANILVPFRRGATGSELGPVTGAISATISDAITTALHLDDWAIEGTLKLANGAPKAIIVNATKCPRTGDAAGESNNAETTTTTVDGAATAPVENVTTVPAAGSGLRTAPSPTDETSTTEAGDVSTSSVDPLDDEKDDEASGPCPTGDSPVDETAGANRPSNVVFAGVYGDDGSVVLDAEVENLGFFDTVWVNGSGGIEVATTGEIEVNVTAELAQPVSFIEGVTLNEASFTITNDSLEAVGNVEVDRNGINLEASAEINLADDEQSIEISGTLSSLTPVSGFTLTDVDVSGKFDNSEQGFKGRMDLRASNVTFGGGLLELVDPTIKVAFDCTGESVTLESAPDDENIDTTATSDDPTTTVAFSTDDNSANDTTTDDAVINDEVTADADAVEKTTDANGCDVAIAASSDLELNVADRNITGSVAGSINTSQDTLTFGGSISVIDFGGGVVLNSVSVEVGYDEGDVSAELSGSLSIFDTTVTASASLSEESVVLEAGLENLTPFGADGPGITAGAIVAVLKQPAASALTWEPTAVELRDLVPEGALLEGDVRVLALVELPEALQRVKALTGDRIELPTQATIYGAYNFGTGAASLDVGTVGGSVVLSGEFSRASDEDEWAYSVNVGGTQAIGIVDGLSLESFNVSVTNLDADGNPGTFSVRGDGKLAIDLASAQAEVSASVDFKSTTEWEVSASGEIATLTAIPGLDLTGVEVSGSITRSDSGYAGTLKLGAEDISFAGGVVKLVDPTLDLAVVCGAPTPTGEASTPAPTTVAPGQSLRSAPAPTTTTAPTTTSSTVTAAAAADTAVEPTNPVDEGCELTLDASSGVEVAISGSTFTGSLSGRLDTDAETANLTATVDDITVAEGVVMTETSFALDIDSGVITFTATGGVNIFDTQLSGKITISRDEAIFQASVAGVAPFGANGPSITTGEVVAALAVVDGGSTWIPIDDRLLSAVEGVELNKGDVRLAAIIGMPAAFGRVEDLTKGVIALPSEMSVTGLFNFTTGATQLTASATSNTFDISGTVGRTASGADWAWSIDFRTNHEIAIIPSFQRLKLTDFSVHIGNATETGEAGTIEVSVKGGISIQVDNSTTLRFGATVDFQSASQWRLTVTGAIAGEDGGSWQLLPGVNLPAASATGTIEKSGDDFTASIRIEQTSDWQPVPQVRIRGLYVMLGVVKNANGWDFEFGLGGQLKLTLGSVSIPELAISGGYQQGVWFLQVDVGDEVCRNVPVAEATPATSDVTPATTVADGASTTASSGQTTTSVNPSTTIAPITTTAAPSTTRAPGQSLRNAPSPTTTVAMPATTVGTTSSTRAADTTTTTEPVVSTTTTEVVGAIAATEEVCERVISITDGLEILNGSFRLEYDTRNNSISAKVSGGLRILGFVINAQVKLSNQGLFMAAGVSNWELFDGGPVFSDMAVVFSTYATTYTLTSGYEANVPGMDVTLIAQMGTPDGIKKTIGDIQLEPLQISLVGLLTGNIDINIGVILPPDAWIFDTGSYGLRLASVGLMLKIRNFADITVGIYGEARLKVPGPPKLAGAETSTEATTSTSITDKCKTDLATLDPNANVEQTTMEVPFRIAIGLSSNGSINISASLGLDSRGNVMPWCNVFGIDGMNIYFAAFSFGINFTTTPIPTPEIGIALAFEFPTVIKDLIGMDEGIKIEGFFFFSTTKGICFGVEIGDPPEVGQTSRDMKKAINIFDGTIIGNYVGFKFAPIGCSIAEKTYEPGISLGFAAQILGISVVAYAKLDVKKLEITAYVNIDPIDVGPIHIDQTYLDLKISGTDPLSSRIIFAGGATLDLPAGPARIGLKVAVVLGTDPKFAIDARIDNLVIIDGILEVNKARIQGLITVSPLAVFINLEGDVKLLGQSVKGSFRLDMDQTGLREISASLSADINVGGVVNFKGSFAFSYLKGGFPSLDFTGSLRISGKELASASGHLDQYYFSISGALDLGVFKGQVAGKMVFCNKDGSIKITNRNKAQVTAARGDFYFQASAAIDLGIVNANGSVEFGRAPDTDVATAEVCPTMVPTVQSQDADAVMDQSFQQTMSTAPGYGCPTTTTAAPGAVTPTTGAGATTTSVACVSAPTTTTTLAPTTTAVGTTSTVPRTTTTIAGALLTATTSATATLSATTVATPTTIAAGSTTTTVVRATTTTRAPGQSLRPRAASATTTTCVDTAALSGYIGFQSAQLACSSLEVPIGQNTVTLNLAAANQTDGRAFADAASASAIRAGGISNLKNFYRFDETSGTALAATTAGTTATAGATGVTVNAAGRFGRALEFTNTGDNRATFAGTRLNDAASWTLSAWIRPADINVARWQTIISGDINALGLHIQAGSDKLALTRIGVGSGTASTTAVVANVWQHVALVKSGTTATYYINGVAAGTTTIPAGNGTNADTRSVGNGTTVNDRFRGSIDDVIVATSAMTATEVKALFDASNVTAPSFTAKILGADGVVVSGAAATVATSTADGYTQPTGVTVTLPSTSTYRRVVVELPTSTLTARVAIAQAPSTPAANSTPLCQRASGQLVLESTRAICDVVALDGSASSVDMRFSPSALATAATTYVNGRLEITSNATWLTGVVQNVGSGAMPLGIKLSATALGAADPMRSARIIVNWVSGTNRVSLGAVTYVQKSTTTAATVTTVACKLGATVADMANNCLPAFGGDAGTVSLRLSAAAIARIGAAIADTGGNVILGAPPAIAVTIDPYSTVSPGFESITVTRPANPTGIPQRRTISITVGGTQVVTIDTEQAPSSVSTASVSCRNAGPQFDVIHLTASTNFRCSNALVAEAGGTTAANITGTTATSIASRIAAGASVQVVSDQPWVSASLSAVGFGTNASVPTLISMNVAALPAGAQTRVATLSVRSTSGGGTSVLLTYRITQVAPIRTTTQGNVTCRERGAGTTSGCTAAYFDAAAGFSNFTFTESELSTMRARLILGGSIEVVSNGDWFTPALHSYVVQSGAGSQTSTNPTGFSIDETAFTATDALVRAGSVSFFYVSPTGVQDSTPIRTMRVVQLAPNAVDRVGDCLDVAASGTTSVLALRCGEIRLPSVATGSRWPTAASGAAASTTSGLGAVFTATTGGTYRITSSADWVTAELMNGAAGATSGDLVINAEALAADSAIRTATLSLIYVSPTGQQTTIATTRVSQAGTKPTNSATLGCLEPTVATIVNVRANCNSVVAVKAATAGAAVFPLDAEMVTQLNRNRATGGATTASSDAAWARVELYDYVANGTGTAVPTTLVIRYDALAEGSAAYREATITVDGVTMRFAQENVRRTTAGAGFAPIACRETTSNAPSTGNFGLLTPGDSGNEAACDNVQVAQQGGSTLLTLKSADAAATGTFSAASGTGATAGYVGLASSHTAVSVRPLFDATSGKIAFAWVTVDRLSSAARDRCSTINLFTQVLGATTSTNRQTLSFCQSKVGTVATSADRPTAFAADGAVGGFDTFPNTFSVPGNTFKFTTQPTAQLVEMKTATVSPLPANVDYRAVPANQATTWTRAMAWNGLLAAGATNKFFVQVDALPFEQTTRSAKFNVEARVNGSWTRIASFYVTQVRDGGTERYTVPDRPSKKITCLEQWNGGSPNPFTVYDSDWTTTGGSDCKTVQVGYRIKGIRVFNSGWGTTPIYGGAWNSTTGVVGLAMIRSNSQFQYIDPWSAEDTSPRIADKNNNATLTGVNEVWTRPVAEGGSVNKINHKRYDINYQNWDGGTRFAYVTGYTSAIGGANFAWRDLDASKMLVNVRFMGIDDVPEFPITPPPPVDGDPGTTGVTCVPGNSPIWYNDGSNNQDKRCRVIEVGSGVTYLGLDVANDVRSSVYADTDGADDCTGPVKVVADTDSPLVTFLRNDSVDYERGGAAGTSCSTRPANGGKTVFTLGDVRPEEVLVARVLLKHTVPIGFDGPKWFEGLGSTLSAADTLRVFDNNNSALETDGEFYIVKYGTKAVEAEQQAWSEAVAAAGEGASPYAVSTPAVGATYAQAAAEQAASSGLAPRVMWGEIRLDAGLNLGPLQGSFSFEGTFSLDGKVNLAMTGTLSAAPLAQASVSGSFKRTTTGDISAKLQFNANVLNVVTVGFKGSISRTNGVTLYDFSGKGQLTLGSAVTGGGSFRLTNMPGQEGLRAEVKFAAGAKGVAYVAGAGSLAFAGDWWNGEFTGIVSSAIGQAQANIKLGNLRVKVGSCPNGGATQNVAGVDYCRLPASKLEFNSTVTVFGQNFALNAEIEGSRFKAQAKAPSNYDGTANRARLNTLFANRTVFWFPFDSVRVGVYWGGQITIQNGYSEPAVSFSGLADVSIQWYGERGGQVGISGTFRPTKLCGRIWRVGFCV